MKACSSASPHPSHFPYYESSLFILFHYCNHHQHTHSDTYLKCHMYAYHISPKQQMCHDIHTAVYKSHYWWQWGYLRSVTITDGNRHSVKVLSLDMPLLKEFIMIIWPAVPKRRPCQCLHTQMDR